MVYTPYFPVLNAFVDRLPSLGYRLCTSSGGLIPKTELKRAHPDRLRGFFHRSRLGDDDEEIAAATQLLVDIVHELGGTLLSSPDLRRV